MKTETLTWHELPSDGLPDADMTVLAEVRAPAGADDDSTEVWPAFWSGKNWLDAGSGWPISAERVVAWADVPVGVGA
jgi:hypothetical protein